MAELEGGQGSSGAGGGGQETSSVAPAPTDLAAENARLKQEKEQLSEQHDKARGYAIALTQKLAELSQQPRAAEPQIPYDQRQQAIKQALDEEPEETLDAHFQQRIAPMMQSQQAMIAQIQRDNFISKIGAEKWNKYKARVEQFVAPMSADTMSRPGAWEQAFNFVRADNIDEEVEDRLRQRSEEGQKRTLLEGGGANGAGASAMNRGLTDLEKTMMNEFGMTEKEWRAYGSRNLTAPPKVEE